MKSVNLIYGRNFSTPTFRRKLNSPIFMAFRRWQKIPFSIRFCSRANVKFSIIFIKSNVFSMSWTNRNNSSFLERRILLNTFQSFKRHGMGMKNSILTEYRPTRFSLSNFKFHLWVTGHHLMFFCLLYKLDSTYFFSLTTLCVNFPAFKKYLLRFSTIYFLWDTIFNFRSKTRPVLWHRWGIVVTNAGQVFTVSCGREVFWFF